jgi:hypothetical protein
MKHYPIPIKCRLFSVGESFHDLRKSSDDG